MINEDNFILELKNKNEKALDYVIDNYSHILVYIIDKHLFYLEDRKDECLNDCLLAIWDNIEYYNPEKAKFTSWIGGIAKYKSIDYIRKYLKDNDLKDLEDLSVSNEEDSLDIVLEKEFNSQIRELLSYLDEEDRQIFIETYFKDRSAKEISDKLNLNESIIYNRLSRGRHKLKLIWEGENNE